MLLIKTKFQKSKQDNNKKIPKTPCGIVTLCITQDFALSLTTNVVIAILLVRRKGTAKQQVKLIQISFSYKKKYKNSSSCSKSNVVQINKISHAFRSKYVIVNISSLVSIQNSTDGHSLRHLNAR